MATKYSLPDVLSPLSLSSLSVLLLHSHVSSLSQVAARRTYIAQGTGKPYSGPQMDLILYPMRQRGTSVDGNTTCVSLSFSLSHTVPCFSLVPWAGVESPVEPPPRLGLLLHQSCPPRAKRPGRQDTQRHIPYHDHRRQLS